MNLVSRQVQCDFPLVPVFKAAKIWPRRRIVPKQTAGHAVLLAAGGRVCDLAGEPLRYGKPGFENPHFVASGRA